MALESAQRLSASDRVSDGLFWPMQSEWRLMDDFAMEGVGRGGNEPLRLEGGRSDIKNVYAGKMECS